MEEMVTAARTMDETMDRQDSRGIRIISRQNSSRTLIFRMKW